MLFTTNYESEPDELQLYKSLRIRLFSETNYSVFIDVGPRITTKIAVLEPLGICERFSCACYTHS